jgi:phosphatidylserine decarboxylase
MGSTIIVLFGKDKVKWESEFIAGKKVQLGEMIGRS